MEFYEETKEVILKYIERKQFEVKLLSNKLDSLDAADLGDPEGEKKTIVRPGGVSSSSAKLSHAAQSCVRSILQQVESVKSDLVSGQNKGKKLTSEECQQLMHALFQGINKIKNREDFKQVMMGSKM